MSNKITYSMPVCGVPNYDTLMPGDMFRYRTGNTTHAYMKVHHVSARSPIDSAIARPAVLLTNGYVYDIAANADLIPIKVPVTVETKA